jgi:uncharacterized protein YbbK (DUF523 family)
MENPIKIGISSCLMGNKVRYDGGHKHDSQLTDAFGRMFTFVPVCPEVGSGLPIPREAMRLEGNPANPRLVTVESRIDLTDQVRRYSIERVAELERQEICGFIFKGNSPSSGLHQVKVYNTGMPIRYGRGLFAAEVVKQFPHLPVEEEGALADPILRENFMERVYTYSRWKAER